MTPAIKLLEEHKITHQVHAYEHDPGAASYGEEAAQKLGLEYGQVFKTLVVDCDDKLAVCIVPVNSQLDLKKAAKALGGKRCQMADAQRVQRSSGYVLGGVSPLGQKRLLKTLLDDSAAGQATVFVSAGRRGLEIELSPHDLADLLAAQFVAIAKN